jgi:hypothetical protein
MIRLRTNIVKFTKTLKYTFERHQVTKSLAVSKKGIFPFCSEKPINGSHNGLPSRQEDKPLPVSITKIEEDYESLVYFQVLQNIFYSHFNKQVQETKPERSAALQREIGLRSTLSQRVFGDIDITFRAELEKFIVSWDKSYSELKEYFEERYMENRLTMHPTEGK